MHNSLFSDDENIWVGSDTPLPFNSDKGFLFYKTSGSQSQSKWIAYKKENFLKAAESANQFLNVTDKDTWLDVLPSNHVASLSVKARSYSAGFETIDSKVKWCPEDFTKKMNEATASSLVPTQVYDLVNKGLKAPNGIRFILVGGGALSEDLYKKARSLGWPLLPTYGMSEAGSQIATASLETLNTDNYPQLSFLSHIQPTVNSEGYLQIKSNYLFEGYYNESSGLIDKREIVFQTTDKAIIKNSMLVSVARESSVQKVLGVLVDKEEVKSKLLARDKRLTDKVELLFVKDNRSENKLILVSDFEFYKIASDCVRNYNQFAEGPYKVSRVYYLKSIPRAELNKLKTQDVLHLLGLY